MNIQDFIFCHFPYVLEIYISPLSQNDVIVGWQTEAKCQCDRDVVTNSDSVEASLALLDEKIRKSKELWRGLEKLSAIAPPPARI